MFSVVILNYNRKDLVKTCLESIKKADLEKLVDEIIIVDNGSTDGSIETIKRFQETKNKKQTSSKFQTPRIKLIKNKKNLGFAAANNQGIKKAKNDWVIILNNDIKLRSGWFKAIKFGISRHQKEKVGSFFGKVINWQGDKIESIGLNFNLAGKAANIGNQEKNLKTKYQKEQQIFGAPGCAACYFKPALKKVGFFDEDFFIYVEDVDLALRFQNDGWRSFYLPSAVCHHLGGATTDKISGFRYKLTAANWWFIIIKHYPFKTIINNLGSILVEQGKNFLAINGCNNKIWMIKRVLSKMPKMFSKRQPILSLKTIAQK